MKYVLNKCCYFWFFFLFHSIDVYAYQEMILGIPLDVIEAKECPICMGVPEEGESVVFDRSACIEYDHVGCASCYNRWQYENKSRLSCPICRLCPDSAELKKVKDGILHPELLRCSGCKQSYTRQYINDHLIACIDNGGTRQQIEEKITQAVQQYLIDNPSSVSVSADSTDNMEILSVNDSTIQEVFNDVSGKGKSAEISAYVTNRQQGFYAFDSAPYLTVVQFPELAEGAAGNESSAELLYMSSMSQTFKEKVCFSQAPDEIKQYLQSDEVEKQRPAEYHSLVAIQEQKAPIAFGFLPNSSCKDIDLVNKKDKYFLIYSVDIPNCETHWGIKEIKNNRRLLLEASSEYKLVLPEAMSDEIEQEIQEKTGTSVRNNSLNSVKYSLFITKEPEGYQSVEEIGSRFYGRGDCRTRGMYVVDGVSVGSIQWNSYEDSGVSTHATFKFLSSRSLPEKYFYPVKSEGKGSLFVLAAAVFLVDVIHTPVPATAQKMHKGLLRQLAIQQNAIVKDMMKKMQ